MRTLILASALVAGFALTPASAQWGDHGNHWSEHSFGGGRHEGRSFHEHGGGWGWGHRRCWWNQWGERVCR